MFVGVLLLSYHVLAILGQRSEAGQDECRDADQEQVENEQDQVLNYAPDAFILSIVDYSICPALEHLVNQVSQGS